jgi:hypothetical protein
MNQLLNTVFSFRCARFAVKILTDNYVGRQLTPVLGNLAIRLLKESFAAFIFNCRAAGFPFDSVEWVDACRAELSLDLYTDQGSLSGNSGTS